MLSVLLLGLAIVGGGAALASMGTGARRARGDRRRAAPVVEPINPRTERPWCEMTVADFTPSERVNEGALLRWARCTDTVRADMDTMVDLLNDDFDNAESDQEAMRIANLRDAAFRAWTVAHDTEANARAASRQRTPAYSVEATTGEEEQELASRERVYGSQTRDAWNAILRSLGTLPIRQETSDNLETLARLYDGHGETALASGLRRRYYDAVRASAARQSVRGARRRNRR